MDIPSGSDNTHMAVNVDRGDMMNEMTDGINDSECKDNDDSGKDDRGKKVCNKQLYTQNK